MKKALNPASVAVVLALAVAAIGGLFWWKSAGMYPIQADSKSMPMPKEAAEEMARMQQKRQAEAAQSGGRP